MGLFKKDKAAPAPSKQSITYINETDCSKEYIEVVIRCIAASIKAAKKYIPTFPQINEPIHIVSFGANDDIREYMQIWNDYGVQYTAHFKNGSVERVQGSITDMQTLLCYKTTWDDGRTINCQVECYEDKGID